MEERDHGSYGQDRRYILAALERIEDAQLADRREIVALGKTIERMRGEARIWSAVAGAIFGGIMSLLVAWLTK